MAARLAAEHMTMRQLDDLGELLAHHAAQPALAAGEAYLQRSTDDDFHFAIARASRCERIE
ncbi:FCD domain-containing protein, partial [Klebsiella pneumoniae]|uniref:FCD domain-containing protein n=1 Tax=Klebsiella pneumoniae TaxID=573 RepID=UPI0034D76E22